MVDKISSLNRQIAVLKDEFLAIQNDLNAIYWPRLAIVNKKLKNYKWYFLMSICLVVAVLISVFANVIRNEVLIGGSIGLTVALSVFLFIILKRTLNKKEIINKSWDKEKEPMNEKKNKMDELINESKSLMADYISSQKGKEVVDEIGDAYDDLLEYFNRLINEEEGAL